MAHEYWSPPKPPPRMNSRLLLVSYHFGPARETGALRWNAMASYLASAGWAVDVITAAKNGNEHPYVVDSNIRVTPVHAPRPIASAIAGVGRIRRRLLPRQSTDSRQSPSVEERSSVSSNDADVYSRVTANIDAAARWLSEIGWARRAARTGLDVLEGGIPTAVAVSSPPHGTQLAGVLLSEALGVPLVADFRDPWLFGDRDDVNASALDLMLGRRLQRRVFRATTKIVLNTPWSERAAVAHAPTIAGRTETIPNGYDRRAAVGKPDREFFRVAFVGWLYDFMDPEPVLAACGRLLRSQNLQALRVEFVGTSATPGGVSLTALAAKHGLTGFMEHRSRVPRDEALAAQERAAVQIVFDYPSPLRVPMKLYDGMQMYGDLLVIGRRASAVGDVASRLGLQVCEPDDPAAIDAVLRRAVERWRSNDYDNRIDVDGLYERDQVYRPLERMLANLPGSPGAVA